MIKRALFAGVFTLVLAAAAAAEMPLGVVDTEKIINEESRFARAQKEIDEMIGQFEDDRERFEKELEDLSARLEEAQSDQRRSLIEMYGRRMAEKSRKYQTFMAETFGSGGIIETQTDKIMGPLYEKLELACKKVGERLRIYLVLDRAGLGALYIADTLDITDAVLTELKKTW